MPATAESTAVLEGGKTTKEMGLGKIILETDSEIVFTAMRRKTGLVEWQLRPVTQEIKKLRRSFQEVQLSLLHGTAKKECWFCGTVYSTGNGPAPRDWFTLSPSALIVLLKVGLMGSR